MKLDPRNPACILAATLLALVLSGCGQGPLPKPVVKAVPVPLAPVNQDAEKAEAAKAEAARQAARAAADKELAGRVKAALTAERNLNAHGIDVVAKDGAVTLYGTAETRVRRDTAEKIAARVDGVKSVENKLAIVAGS